MKGRAQTATAVRWRRAVCTAPALAYASRRAVAPRLAIALALAIALWIGIALWLAGPAVAVVPPSLKATAAALSDADTGQLLYADHGVRKLPIASTTKLMTALVTLERVRLSAVFADPNFHFAPVDSQIGLVPGERMTVHDLLLALLLPSADDAAQDLAYNVGGRSVARFVSLMNARARQLRLNHTHYATPIGLDTPGNYSTAEDLVKLARYDLRAQPFLRHAVGLGTAVLHSGAATRVITNRNDLVGRVRWINGVKTGHTQQAGYVLVGSGTRNGMTLISAVLGTPTEAQRDAATLALLRYGFSEFALRTPVRSGALVARPRVRYRPRLRARVVAARSYTHVFIRGQSVSTRAVVPRQLNGPLARGARVGTLLVLADGRVAVRIPLVMARALAHFNPPGVSLAWVVAAITLVSVLLLAAAVALRRRFGRAGARARAAVGRRATAPVGRRAR